VGTALVGHVLATAVELNAQAACRAVVVNALHASARGWREHLGFSPFDPADEQSLDLFLLTADIEATLRPDEITLRFHAARIRDREP
jgi:hypothetical protein